MSTQFTNRQWRLPNNENKDKQSNYSMDFDSASSDYIEIYSGTVGNLPPSFSIGASDSQTISCWVKSNVTTSNHFIWLQRGTNPYLRLFLNYNSGTDSYRAGFAVRDDSNVEVSEISDSTNSVNRNQWNHIAAVIDRTNAKLYVYVNGVVTGTGTALGSLGAITQITDINIGRDSAAGGRYYFDGQIDAVSIYDYALSASQVTTLYGSSSTGIGNPMSLNPVAFYQLGDKSAFNGANYLVPNIAAEEDDGDIATSYSPYALDFDGTNDYIDTNTNLNSLGVVNTFSISLWVKIATNGNYDHIIGAPTSYSAWNTGFGLYTNTTGVRFWVDQWGPSGNTFVNSASLSLNVWYHIAATFDTTNGLKLYVNAGTPTTATGNGILDGLTNDIYIASTGTNTNYAFNGSISNVSIWNTELTSAQVTELYNEGVPSNLNNHSAYSNLVSWWQLGSNSSFNSTLNQWTCIDEKGTNTGESSQTFNEDAIVDGVGSYANGLSSGMGGDEVIGSAPFSDANSLSINMDVLDRTDDTPN